MLALRSTPRSEMPTDELAPRAEHATADADPAKLPFFNRARDAGNDIVGLLRTTYSDTQGRLYAETAIAAGAGLAGELALRSTGLPLPGEGSLVVGGMQDGILFAHADQPTVWSMITRAAGTAGLATEELPDLSAIVARTLTSIGKTNFPPLTVPLANLRDSPPNACARLRAEVCAIGKRHHLDLAELAVVLGWATGSLILMARNGVRPAISVRLAAEVMIAMSRMGPLSKPTA